MSDHLPGPGKLIRLALYLTTAALLLMAAVTLPGYVRCMAGPGHWWIRPTGKVHCQMEALRQLRPPGKTPVGPVSRP